MACMVSLRYVETACAHLRRALILSAPASRLPILYSAMIQHIAQERLPSRENRINPRVVKKKMSNFGKKRPEHYHVPKPQTTFRQSVVIFK